MIRKRSKPGDAAEEHGPQTPMIIQRDEDGRLRVHGGSSPLLRTYLESDLQEDAVAADAMLAAVRAVLEGRMEQHSSVGNACSVQLDRHQVLLESLHTEEEDRVRTPAFLEAVVAWRSLLES